MVQRRSTFACPGRGHRMTATTVPLGWQRVWRWLYWLSLLGGCGCGAVLFWAGFVKAQPYPRAGLIVGAAAAVLGLLSARGCLMTPSLRKPFLFGHVLFALLLLLS